MGVGVGPRKCAKGTGASLPVAGGGGGGGGIPTVIPTEKGKAT